MKKRELAILFPREILVIGGEEIELRPFAWKDFERVTEIVAQYAEIIAINSNSIDIARAILGTGEKGVLKDIAELIKMSTGLDSEELQDCGYDEVISLFAEVIGANLSFFSRLGEALAKKANPVAPAKAAKARGGFTPTTDSSAGDTDPAI